MGHTSKWFTMLWLVLTIAHAPGSESLKTTGSLRRSDPGITEYILRGRAADIVTAPWQVRLQILKATEEFPEGAHFSCGGSIIDSHWIITAAHCVDDASEIKIILGSTHLDPSSSPYAVTMLTDQYFSHPKFGREVGLVNGVKIPLGNRFDVALLQVAQEIKYNVAIQPLKIEDPSWTGQPDETFTAYGWGQTSGTNAKSTSDRLRSVRIPKVSTDYCYKQYNIKIGAEMICAGATDRGVCRGDSGGPLVNERKRLVGIVSYGSKECNSYSLFTHITNRKVYSWIKETVNSLPAVATEEEQYPFSPKEQAKRHFHPVAREEPMTHRFPGSVSQDHFSRRFFSGSVAPEQSMTNLFPGSFSQGHTITHSFSGSVAPEQSMAHRFPGSDAQDQTMQRFFSASVTPEQSMTHRFPSTVAQDQTIRHIFSGSVAPEQSMTHRFPGFMTQDQTIRHSFSSSVSPEQSMTHLSIGSGAQHQTMGHFYSSSVSREQPMAHHFQVL